MSNPILDREGNLIGYQDADGTVRDLNNKKLGHITHEGAVYDARRDQVGAINERGDVMDRYGRQVGSISTDGTVQDWHGIPVYSGSAAPLLIDFAKSPRADPIEGRLDFDRLAREAESPKRERAPLSILPEGFVSPSVIGCLGIALAVLVGIAIMFVLQNPGLLSRSATPTASAVAAETPRQNSAGTTPAPNSEPGATATPQQATGKVNVDILNLRQGPATSFEIVDRLQQDTQVVITGRLNDNIWLKVTVPGIGKEGWVAAQYINTDVDIATIPVVQPPAQ